MFVQKSLEVNKETSLKDIFGVKLACIRKVGIVALELM